MKAKRQRIVSWIAQPPVWGIVIIFVVTVFSIAAALVCVFAKLTGVLTYIAYVLSAFSLAYSVYLIVRFVPKIKAWVMEKLTRRQFTRSLVGDYSFRTLVFATCSFVINCAFVAFNTVQSILTQNGWYGGLAGYYFLLGGLRGCVFFWDKRAKTRAGEDETLYKKLQWRNYGFCGGALFMLNVALTVIVVFMVSEQKPNRYTEIMAIVFAAYAFYKISLAIYNLFKAKKTKDLQIQAFRNLGLVDAAVSILSLQTALIATFSTGEESMLVLNAIVGAGVCLLNIFLAVYMIIQSVKQRRIS